MRSNQLPTGAAELATTRRDTGTTPVAGSGTAEDPTPRTTTGRVVVMRSVSVVARRMQGQSTGGAAPTRVAVPVPSAPTIAMPACSPAQSPEPADARSPQIATDTTPVGQPARVTSKAVPGTISVTVIWMVGSAAGAVTADAGDPSIPERLTAKTMARMPETVRRAMGITTDRSTGLQRRRSTRSRRSCSSPRPARAP